MRVVVQNGEYWLCNKGDLAMLDVTVRRLSERWPGADIGVITSAPHLLRAYAPAAVPLRTGAGAWPRATGITLGPRVVGPPSVAWLTAQQRVHRYTRRLGAAPPAPRVPAAADDASLVLAMGGGYFTDVDPEQVHRTLDLLEHAADRGIPTAMLGQGIGPLEDPVLLDRARAVLPRVDVIALREGREGPRLLDALGVAPERITVTGDDAIELAHAARRGEPGTDIGLCVRVARYSPVAQCTAASVGQVVRRFAAETGTTLRPLIVSEYRSEDRRSTMPLVAGFPRVAPVAGRYVTAADLAALVAECRVLVTGAYHLAVFALSQGIPVVGLTASRYYDDKLLGLRDMFGGGLHLVRLDDARLEERLADAARAAWEEAPHQRAPLLAAARAQIETSRQAFQRVFDLVEAGQRETAS